MKRSIRFYYFTSVAAVLVAGVLLMGLVLLYMAVNYFSTEKMTELGKVLENIVHGIEIGDIDPYDRDDNTLNYIAAISDADITVTDLNGRVLYYTDRYMAPQTAQLSEEVISEIKEGGHYEKYSNVGGMFERRCFAEGIQLRAKTGHLIGYIFATSDASNLRGYVLEILATFLLAATSVVLIASLLALILARRTVLPITRINAAAQALTEGDFSARAPVEGGGELSQLAISFNEMASNFESADLLRRQFMGNIAHELRTPMTSIKGFIDGILDETIPADQRQKYLVIVSDEVGRLTRLTQNMLDISGLEAGNRLLSLQPVDIVAKIEAVLATFEPRFAENGLTIQFEHPQPGVKVMAEDDYLHEVLYNILDNAIKFSYKGGTVRATVEVEKASATISVFNTGAGIPKSDMPYIFDRFFKTDQSRGNKSGSGLGLYICRLLIAMMGGRIWAESQEGAWMDIHFTLPLQQAKKSCLSKRIDGAKKDVQK